MVTIELNSKETGKLLTEFELSDEIIDIIKKEKKPSQTLEEAISETLENAMEEYVAEEKNVNNGRRDS